MIKGGKNVVNKELTIASSISAKIRVCLIFISCAMLLLQSLGQRQIYMVNSVNVIESVDFDSNL